MGRHARPASRAQVRASRIAAAASASDRKRPRKPGSTQIQPTPNTSPPEDVAARLKVKEKTVRDWIARGMLEAYKIGKVWRIRKDHLDQAMGPDASAPNRPLPADSGTPTTQSDFLQTLDRRRRSGCYMA
jgi:excisionase family DNA binding protein